MVEKEDEQKDKYGQREGSKEKEMGKQEERRDEYRANGEEMITDGERRKEETGGRRKGPKVSRITQEKYIKEKKEE